MHIKKSSYWHRKDFWSGLAVIGAHEVGTQFLNISVMNFITSPKSGLAKTGPAGPAPKPMIEEKPLLPCWWLYLFSVCAISVLLSLHVISRPLSLYLWWLGWTGGIQHPPPAGHHHHDMAKTGTQQPLRCPHEDEWVWHGGLWGP